MTEISAHVAPASGVVLLVVFLSAGLAFVKSDLYAYIAKNLVRCEGQKLAFVAAAIGTWIALYIYLTLAISKLEMKVCVLRFQNRILRFENSYLLLQINNPLPHNCRKWNLFQDVKYYAHLAVFLLPGSLTGPASCLRRRSVRIHPPDPRREIKHRLGDCDE